MTLNHRHGSFRALVVLMFASTLARAESPTAPSAEEMKAARDSAYIEALLDRPFASEHRDNQIAVKELYYSGNQVESKLLERAEERRMLAAIVGDGAAGPSTMREAIARESSAGTLEDGLRALLARVRVTYATGKEADAIATEKEGDRTRVSMDLGVENRLAVPVEHLSVRLEPPGMAAIMASCEGSGPRNIAPGSRRIVRCWWQFNDGTDRIDPAIRALAGHAAALRAVRIITREGNADETLLYSEDYRAESTDKAFAALSRASCQDKGSCAAIAAAEANRRQERQAAQAPARTFGLLGLAVLLIATVAALRVKPRPVTGFLIPIVAAAVIVFAALAAAIGYWSLVPGEGYGPMLGLVLLYYGALPFGAALLTVCASLAAGNVTRLRAFAAVFGAAMTLLIIGTMLSMP
jgi:hypothetical protein